MRIRWPIAVILLPVLGSACAVANGSTGNGRVVVVATTTQIGDLVRNVAGPSADVHQILRPNTDPHDYEPRPTDVLAVGSASVIFENGDGLDGWMSKVVAAAGGNPRQIVLGNAVPDRVPGASSGTDASRFDPHWWTDPVNVEAAVRTIRGALGRIDPAHRAGYERRAANYLAKVHALDIRIRSCFDRVPPPERTLVTSHDAFRAMARRYGIRIVGAIVPSQATQAEPSAREVAQLIELIRREHVRAIFPETAINEKLAEQIAHATGATAAYSLYGDTLGPPGSPGATYLGMELANADAMVRGFTGGAGSCSP